MKICIECGIDLSDDAKFCKKCAAKQPEKKIEQKKQKTEKEKPANKQKVKIVTAKKSAMVKSKKDTLNFQERKQEIYEMTSQDNCGECDCKNCMQFAMQAASLNSSMELTDCTYIDHDEAVNLCNNYDWV